MSNPLINFKNVYLKYDDVEVLKSIDLVINEGEHTVILGSNGSGKSSLIKLISCELYPSIMGIQHTREILSHTRWDINELRQHIGIVTNDLHNRFLFDTPHISGLEVVISGFFGTLGVFNHQEIKESHKIKVLEVMSELNISHLSSKKLSTMSTGELRKCIVARALVHPLQLLLLDEPTVGLDIKSQIDFIDFMRKLSKDTTILLVTHHIEEIFSEINRVICIKNGEIVADGVKNKLLNSKNISNLFDTDVEIVKNGENYAIYRVN